VNHVLIISISASKLDLILQSWWWRQDIPLHHQYPSTRIHGIKPTIWTTQKLSQFSIYFTLLCTTA